MDFPTDVLGGSGREVGVGLTGHLSRRVAVEVDPNLLLLRNGLVGRGMVIKVRPGLVLTLALTGKRRDNSWPTRIRHP